MSESRTNAPAEPTRPRTVTRPAADWLAGLVVPVLLAAAVLLVDLFTVAPGTRGVMRSGLLAFYAALLQLVVVFAAVPWWSAGLLDRNDFGAFIAASRMVVMVAASTVLLAVVALVQDRGGYVELVKVQVVVASAGLLMAGLAGVLHALTRSVTFAGLATSLAGFVFLATPFWGNALIRACGEVGRGWAWQLVVKTTPMLACADAVSQDLLRHAPRLYASSLLVDSARAFPAWWAYALVTALAGAALVWLVTFVRRHVVMRS